VKVVGVKPLRVLLFDLNWHINRHQP
jgi:hypothetical protein